MLEEKPIFSSHFTSSSTHDFSLISFYERVLTFIPSLITMKFFAAIPLILGAALQAVAQTADAAQAAELVADLKRAPTQLARLTILKNNEDVSIRLSSTL